MNANPFAAPAGGSGSNDVDRQATTLDRLARITIVAALVYMLAYMPYFFVQGYRMSHGVDVSPLAIFPAHFLGMALNIAAFVLTIRDLYLRPFPNPNTKLTWLLLILLTGGIGWLVYVFKYALKPRSRPAQS